MILSEIIFTCGSTENNLFIAVVTYNGNISKVEAQKNNAVTKTLCIKISNEKLRNKVKFSLNKFKIKNFEVKLLLIQASTSTCPCTIPRCLIELEHCGKLLMKSYNRRPTQ